MDKSTTVITSDGFLTRASKSLPYSVRAVVVTSYPKIENNYHVSVTIGDIGRLEWASDLPPMTLAPDRLTWVGGMWTFLDTKSFQSVTFIAGQNSAGISVKVARTAHEATVEMARSLLNNWLKVRPGVTYEVCEAVHEAVHGKLKGVAAWKSIKDRQPKQSSSSQ